ncbi:MAG: hypothetical protein J0H34_22540 [Rhizobiales bacterium]|nr:hypothetical protein [Hyphomicrobiales bacterium]
MNIGEIAELFIRAAEIERALPDRVGPAPLRAQQLPYVHSLEDMRYWRKEPGDKLAKGADPYAEERRAFWERMVLLPTAAELRELDGLYDILMLVDDDGQRRALLAWARSKVGGKAFRRWCFQVEGIHAETGRRRKDRALAAISGKMVRGATQDSEIGRSPLLHSGGENGHISDTITDDVIERGELNSWMSENARLACDGEADFSWAQKRWERRRKREAAKLKAKTDESPKPVK